MSKELELSKRNVEFKRDTIEQLLCKYYNEKYIDYRSSIIDVLVYRDEKRIKREKNYFKNRFSNYDYIKYNLPYKDSQLPF